MLQSSLAIVGASYLQVPLVRKAKGMGLRTVCFAWEDGAVCKEICDAFYPISIVEKQDILHVCRQEKIAGITTIASDLAVPTVSFVARNLHLPGNSEHSAFLSTNKAAMRHALSTSGVNCPDYGKAGTFAEARSIVDRIGLPVIVKPVDRSGSMGVCLVNSWAELQNAIETALSCSLCHEVVVERFITDAREISVEGISHYGKYHLLAVTDKVTTGAPHFVELGHHQPSTISRTMLEKVRAIVQRSVSALEITDGATHSELMITPASDVYVTEIGARMGGDFIGSDLVRLSTGYDFLKGVIEVALGHFAPPVLTEEKHAGVWFYSNQTRVVGDVIRSASGNPRIVRAEINDETLHPLYRSADRSGYFIYQSDCRMSMEGKPA